MAAVRSLPGARVTNKGQIQPPQERPPPAEGAPFIALEPLPIQNDSGGTRRCGGLEPAHLDYGVLAVRRLLDEVTRGER
jgi:hypothetical protein